MYLRKVLSETIFANADKIQKISGGDINAAYKFSNGTDDFFIKLNNADQYPELFQKEANGLDELRANSAFKIPEIIHVGKHPNTQFLILEFLPSGNLKQNSWKNFAENLAAMHKVSQKYFGFYEHNYLGTQKQDNSPKNSWAEFYSESRIEPSMKQAFDKGVFEQPYLKKAENICSKFSEIFPEEPSSLLHGDLWNGNYHVLQSGEITLIDPAVYYGHREIDLGMAFLFGGFDEEFYQIYSEHYPLEPGFEQRYEISQLYPLIFHAIRFGGSYTGHVKRILDKFS